MANSRTRGVDAELLERIDDYIERLFVPSDAVLDANLARAGAAGLPAINVSATEGKLLYLIARLIRARRVLEVGTLGGYSTTWLARALPAGGVVVTLEVDPAHAAVAQANLAGVAPDVTVDIRVGDAAAAMRALRAAGEPPFDLIFIDADKPGYVRYLDLALDLARSGTVILADNVIRHGEVIEPRADDSNAVAASAYNTAIATNARLESIVLPIIREKVDGLAISIVI
jgi:predicted O-methyltransferase YrrM